MSDEGRELAQHDGGQSRALVETPGSGGVLASVLAASRDPSIDADKVRSMVELGLKLQDRELRAEFNRDKIAAVRAMPAIYKRGKSDKHRYAKFEDLHRAVMPVLSAHNLTLDFRVGSEGNMITVQPVLRHDNGTIEEGGVMKAGPDQGPGRSPVQAVGSTTSYLKRHSMKAMLNIIEDDEDDDGAGGLASRQLNDRQQNLILAGQAAADKGEYDGWYGKLPPKDRAWMVSTGHHARIGGGAALPAPSGQEPEDAVIEEVRDDPPAQEERREPEPEDRGGNQTDSSPAPKATRTPEQMVEAYESGVDGCKDLDALATYQAEPKRKAWVDKLKAAHPELHKRVLDANSRRYSEIIDAMPSRSGGDAGPLL